MLVSGRGERSAGRHREAQNNNVELCHQSSLFSLFTLPFFTAYCVNCIAAAEHKDGRDCQASHYALATAVASLVESSEQNTSRNQSISQAIIEIITNPSITHSPLLPKPQQATTTTLQDARLQTPSIEKAPLAFLHTRFRLYSRL